MDRVKLLRLMLRYFEHLHGEYPKTVFFELLNDIANRILGNGIWFDDGKSALQSLHVRGLAPF
jgi:hypothetical protein